MQKHKFCTLGLVPVLPASFASQKGIWHSPHSTTPSHSSRPNTSSFFTGFSCYFLDLWPSGLPYHNAPLIVHIPLTHIVSPDRKTQDCRCGLASVTWSAVLTPQPWYCSLIRATATLALLAAIASSAHTVFSFRYRSLVFLCMYVSPLFFIQIIILI